MKSKKQIAAGTKFTDWTVLKEVQASNTARGGWKRRVRVQCQCGKIKDVQLDNLLAGTSKRCNNCGAKVRADKLRQQKRPDGEVNKKCAFGRYRLGAKKRNLAFNIDFETFLQIAAQPCHYCGTAPSNCYNLKHSRGPQKGQPRAGKSFVHNGLDRIDSAAGYNRENCVPCCKRCNVAKSNMSLNEFYQWVIAVYQQLQKQKGEQQTNGASISSRAV